jgi:hypothetical protein
MASARARIRIARARLATLASETDGQDLPKQSEIDYTFEDEVNADDSSSTVPV